MKPERLFAIAAALLLVIFATLQVTSALRENQSYDEHFHLSSGFAIWKAADYMENAYHPPLAAMLAALPLLPMGLVFNPAWDEVGLEFLYHNRAPAGRILFTGRVPMMIMAILFGLALALWVRREFGVAPALASLAFYCLDPNIVAHSRYITNDVMMAFTAFLSVITAVKYLETGTRRHLILFAACYALAILTKYSTLVLLPVWVFLYFVRRWQQPEEFTLRRLVRHGLIWGGIIAVFILIVFWPAHLSALRAGIRFAAENGWHRDTRGLLRTIARNDPFTLGLLLLREYNQGGNPTYLLGQLSEKGWWYYFPVVFAVKSTAACLAGAIFAFAAGAAWLKRGEWISRLRNLPIVWYGLVATPVWFLGAAMTSHVNIGIRHILLIYPFLYILTALALLHSRLRLAPAVLGLLIAIQAAECASIYPDYLAFFNILAGGPGNGPHYLADSNIDWGQDAHKLAQWLRARGTNHVYFAYFGSDKMSNEHLDVVEVPHTNDLAGRAAIDGFVAVSATRLVGLYWPPEETAWLREQQPVAKVGYSIYVYDMRQKR